MYGVFLLDSLKPIQKFYTEQEAIIHKNKLERTEGKKYEIKPVH